MNDLDRRAGAELLVETRDEPVVQLKEQQGASGFRKGLVRWPSPGPISRTWSCGPTCAASTIFRDNAGPSESSGQAISLDRYALLGSFVIFERYSERLSLAKPPSTQRRTRQKNEKAQCPDVKTLDKVFVFYSIYIYDLLWFMRSLRLCVFARNKVFSLRSRRLALSCYPWNRGSSLSRRKSPRILKEITVMLMASPGNMTIQGAELMYILFKLIIEAHVGVAAGRRDRGTRGQPRAG